MESRRRFLARTVPVTLGTAALLAGCSTDTSSPLAGSSTTTPSSPPAPPKPADARFRYGKHPNQWADLYLPSTGTKFPVVVTIHGGGWTVGVDATETVPFAGDLIRDGIAVWNIEYRLLDGGGGWPTTFHDVATAIDLLPKASKGRLDLGTVISFGASAGGHLAAWAASRHRIPAQHRALLGGVPKQRLRGAVAYAAPLDLVYDSDNYGGSVHLMDGTPTRRRDRYAAGSPYALLPIGIPVTCLHGDADQVIPYAQSKRYVAKAKQLGNPAKLITLPGVDHNNTQPLRIGEPLWNQTKAEIHTLLGR